MLRIVRAKLHCIRVTGADLNYHGSITLDPEHCEQAGIYPLEFVEIWNKQSGARISTYVIFGEPGSRCCILNGAAARTCQQGDELIVAASEYLQPRDLCAVRPRVLTFAADNEVSAVLSYVVSEGRERRFDFRVVDETETVPAPAAQAHVPMPPDLARLEADLRERGWPEAEIAAFIDRHFQALHVETI